MTVQTTHSENSFVGDGATQIFNFTFAVMPDSPELLILLDNEEQSTGFLVSPFSNQSISPGGSIIFDTPPSIGADIRAKRRTPQTQEVDFPLEAKLNTEKLELALDKNVLQIQDLRRDLGERTFIWKGAWDAGMTYQPGEAVSNDGVSYICLTTNTTSEPPSADWDVLSAKGDTGPQGIQGIQGETGPQGEQGATGDAGADGADGLSVVPRGAWSGATAYVVNDLVSDAGSSYVCILAHTNHQPPNLTYWNLMAQKGDTGATGAAGADGTDGTNGTDGADGVINQLQLGGSNVTTQPILNFDDAFFDVDNAGGKNTVTFVGDTVSGTSGEIDVAAGVVGLADNAVLPGTAGAKLPTGTTVQRGATESQIRYNVDDDCYEYLNASEWVQLKKEPVVCKVKLTTEGRVNNTLTDDATLQFPIAAGEACSFEAWLFLLAGNATPDFKYALSLPSGCAARFTESDGNTLVMDGGSTVVALSADTPKMVQLKGSIINSTNAGNVILQWAQNTTNANQTQLLRFSFIKKTTAQ